MTIFTDQNMTVMMHCYIKHVTFTKGQREREREQIKNKNNANAFTTDTVTLSE